MLLGVIADDMTGATDVALMLNRAGMRTVQVIGAPVAGASLPDADAVVVALKSRTNPVAEAIADSLAACEALLAAARARSCSNTAQPSIRRRKAISAPSRTR